MQVSLNQIEGVARKAVRGAGAVWGLAEDTGRSVRWLEAMDIDGIEMLARLLAEVDHSETEKLLLEPQQGDWHARSEKMSPIFAGPSLGDLLDNLGSGINLHQLAFPMLCAGFVGAVTGVNDKPIYLQWEGIELEIKFNQLGIVGDSQFLLTPFTDLLSVRSSSQYEAAEFVLRNGEIAARSVKPSSWRHLESLAHRTYVEATAASRLAGAGAGLSDND